MKRSYQADHAACTDSEAIIRKREELIRELHEDLVRDWAAVKSHRDGALSEDPRMGRTTQAFVAVSLDHAYQAFETILVRIERSLGLPERSGGEWHQELLADAAKLLPGRRLPIYPESAQPLWDQILKFRHFFRHAYTVQLDPKLLLENAARLHQAVDATEPFLLALVNSLLEPA